MYVGRQRRTSRTNQRSFSVRAGLAAGLLLGAVGIVRADVLDARVSGTTVTEVQVTGRAGIPSNASAVAINLAAVGPSGDGFISAFPCGSAAPDTASTVNHDTSSATSNSAIVKIGNGGKICLYTLTDSDIIVDVTGWFPAGADYNPIDPNRFLDTRTNNRPNARSTTEVQVTGRAGIPSNASAVAINLAAVGPSGDGFISAFPCGSAAPDTASTVNHDTSSATSNSAIVKIGNGGKICLYTLTDSDIIVDVTGWFPAGADYNPIDPNRFLDTRTAGSPGSPGSPNTAGAQFVETFDGNAGLDRFNRGVYHRDPHNVGMTQWPGDHDLNCGSPATSRTIRRGNTLPGSYASFPADDEIYTCVNHMMTAMGDTSGYSIVWFSPNQVFDDVSQISFDVNLTNLGGRKWWKVGVVSDALYNSTYTNNYGDAVVPGFLVSDVGASALRGNLATANGLFATWSGQASAGWPGGYMKIGNSGTGTKSNPTPTDKATRHPVSFVDNKNGTVTFTVAGVSATRSGAFPACPCRVVFYDHNYTPNKSDPPAAVPNPYTWHWDNIVIR